MDQIDEVNGAKDPGAAPADLQGIGQRIVDRRNQLGLTQRAVARRAGIRAARLSKIERSLKQPKTDELTRLVPVLGVGLEALVYGKSPRLDQQPDRAEVAGTVGRFVDAFRDFLFLLVRLARGGPNPKEEEKEK